MILMYYLVLMAIYSGGDYGSIFQIKKMIFCAYSHTTNTINA